MKNVRKILAFFSIVLIYFVFKEFIQLYLYLAEVNTYLGYAFIATVIAFTIYFVILPLFKIVTMRVNPGPTKDKDKEDQVIKHRLKYFPHNRFLMVSNYSINNSIDSISNYNTAVTLLTDECRRVRSKHINQLFYSTAISQNGFLDAILILSTSVNLVKDIFTLYNGRVSNRDLWIIAKKVYYSIIIGGTEGIEYATEEIYTKLASDTMKSIPFLDKILSSIADGFVNAALLTRVAIITENYCKLTYIKSDKDLYPTAQVVISTTKDITSDLFQRVNGTLIKMAKEKSSELWSSAVNPVVAVFNKSVSGIKEIHPVKKGTATLTSTYQKLVSVFKK